MALGLSEAWRWGSDPNLPWLFRWGAWWDTAGWWYLMLAGSLAVVRHAPVPRDAVTWGLAGVLTATLVAFGWMAWFPPPQVPIGASYGAYVQAFDWAAWFPSTSSWSAWCAISLPLLWAWKKWSAAVPLMGLCLSGSSSAWVAAVVGWGIPLLRHRLRHAWWLMGLVGLIGVYLKEPTTWPSLLGIRWDTWLAVWRTIADTPWGIGWGFGAYQAVADRAVVPILPHAASDWLMLPLRYGWWTIPAFVWVSWWLWRRASSPCVVALRVAWWLSAWQTSVSQPVVGGLVWVVYLWWEIERGWHAERSKAEACA